MDLITSIIVWGMCIAVGVPLALIGLFHLLLPKSAWSAYRGWGKRWGADPQEIAPAYKHGAAMRTVGFATFLGGVFICLVPLLLGPLLRFF